MYVGIADLVARWVYTRQGVHNLVKSASFPASAFTINQGRNKVWRLEDIEAYEKNHPELFDNELKQRKTTGYFLTLIRKPPRPNASGGDI